MKAHSEYLKHDTVAADKFVASIKDASKTEGQTFDSAAAHAFASETINRMPNAKLPLKLQAIFDDVGSKNSGTIMRAFENGISAYEKAHGCDMPADLMEQAIHSAFATTNEARRGNHAFDSANSNHMDNLALQPNRAVVAILSTMGEAIPFAHYLPADIGSNEAILAIMSHQAGSNYGSYPQNGGMDGIMSGDPYITSSRVHQCTIDVSGNATGKLTAKQATIETCDPAAAVVPLVRGRSVVYVNGMIAAQEVSQSGSGLSSVSGSFKIGSTNYLIGGSINTDTGEIALTSTPALPTATPLVVEGFVDYERDPALIPLIISNVDTFKIHAKAWKARTRQSIDARMQMSNELGLDPYSESVLAIQNQFANERHYEVLAKARRLAVNNQLTYDFAWANQGNFKNRADIWLDFATPLGAASQKMAIDTMNHGITHLYVGRNMASMMQSLDANMFESSQISSRPGIHRVGRLFGQYDVYYTPKLVEETSTSSQVLAIGRATDVTRNPFVLGDAVPATVIPLYVGDDLKNGAGFYARNFTAVNPHAPSAMGCALIDVINFN
jgi:hypothetical protein